MTRWQRRLHLWAWPLVALAILASVMLAFEARHRVNGAIEPRDASEAP